MIYFAQGIDGGPIKIGVTTKLKRRLIQLRFYYGRPLFLLATLPGSEQAETSIHERFAHLRIGRTEQFVPDAELLSFIGSDLALGGEPEDSNPLPMRRRKG